MANSIDPDQILWYSDNITPNNIWITLLPSIIIPRLFEEKWRDTVFGFPWRMARGAWRVVRGSEFLVGTLSP